MNIYDLHESHIQKRIYSGRAFPIKNGLILYLKKITLIFFVKKKTSATPNPFPSSTEYELVFALLSVYDAPVI